MIRISQWRELPILASEERKKSKRAKPKKFSNTISSRAIHEKNFLYIQKKIILFKF